MAASACEESVPGTTSGRSLDQHIVVLHPSYANEHHRAQVYRLGGGEGDATIFASTELSAGAWGFFIPEEWARLLLLVKALREAGTEVLTDGFVPDQSGWHCDVRGAIDLSVVRPRIAIDHHRDHILGTDRAIDCLHWLVVDPIRVLTAANPALEDMRWHRHVRIFASRLPRAHP